MLPAVDAATASRCHQLRRAALQPLWRLCLLCGRCWCEPKLCIQLSPCVSLVVLVCLPHLALLGLVHLQVMLDFKRVHMIVQAVECIHACMYLVILEAAGQFC